MSMIVNLLDKLLSGRTGLFLYAGLFLFVTYLLLSPQVASVPMPYSWVSALAHFAVHAALCFSGVMVFRDRELTVLLMLGSYAIGTELLQLLIPGRFFDTADIALNFCGLIIGAFSAVFVLKRL